RLANAGFRYRYLAGVAGHRPGRGTPDRPATQAGCSHGRWRDGHPVRPLDPAGATSALADGTLKARASAFWHLALAPLASLRLLGHLPLVPRLVIGLDDDPRGLLRNLEALQKSIDLQIGDTIGILIGFAGFQFFQIGGRHLFHQLRRRAEGCRDFPNLPLDQSGQWRQVTGAVAELGEEPHDRLGGMIGPDNQALPRIGDGVLGHHAHPRLGIAEHEISRSGRQRLQCLGSPRKPLYRRSDIHRMALVRLDGIDCELAFSFLVLHLIEKAPRDEAVIIPPPGAPHPSPRRLGEQPGRGPIDAATDAQHQGLQSGLAQAVLDEAHSAVDFGPYRGGPIERWPNVECSGDFLLTAMHGFLLWNGLLEMKWGLDTD